MASLYRDKHSPFWYLKFKTQAGKWRSKSLRPLQHRVPTDTRRARAVMDEHSLEEHSRSPQRDAWQTWVPDYIQSRYARSAGTAKRVKHEWNNLREYLEANRATAPQDLTYQLCIDYMPYRKRKAAHNTARMELGTLAMLCDEAIRRGIISRNPAAKLKIPKLRPREKPELTDENIATIRAALKREPDWMGNAFEVALHQGCRLSETNLSISDIDFQGNRLHFRKTKGDKPFTVPLNPNLKPILQDMLRRRVGVHVKGAIFDLPSHASCNFHRFFKKLGIPGVTFHSTRISVATRLARAGYPISLAMRLLNHSSELIHRVYQRLRAEDVGSAFEHLRF